MSLPLTPGRNPNSVAAWNDRMVSAAIARRNSVPYRPPVPLAGHYKAIVLSISRFEDGGHYVRLDTRRDGEMVVFLYAREEDLLARIRSALENRTCHEFVIDEQGGTQSMRGRIMAMCA